MQLQKRTCLQQILSQDPELDPGLCQLWHKAGFRNPCQGPGPWMSRFSWSPLKYSRAKQKPEDRGLWKANGDINILTFYCYRLLQHPHALGGQRDSALLISQQRLNWSSEANELYSS